MFETLFTVGLIGAVVIGVCAIPVAVMIRLRQRTQGEACFFCARVVDEDIWCFGCEQYVCMECDISEPWGEHGIEDHVCSGCDDCVPEGEDG